MHVPVSYLGQFKALCVGCRSSTNPKNKEHPFPKWLIKRTDTDKTGIKWLKGNRIPADQATLPLCIECNSAFGAELEAPMSRILEDIEAGEGLSDNEAELVVRWLWKIEGILWHVSNPFWNYSHVYTLKDRVLKPLDGIREHLTLAIALCDKVDPSYGDAPMGLDSGHEVNSIFVSGVFSRTGMMVVLNDFAHLIPARFSKYELLPTRGGGTADAKLFFPPSSFASDAELVRVTIESSLILTEAHEIYARQVQARLSS